MSNHPQRINNKEKQAAGGQGINKFAKQYTEVPDPLMDEVPKHRGKRKKKQRKPDWVCPFCNGEIPRSTDEPRNIIEEIWGKPTDICPQCGARAIEKACPCCGRDTWELEGEYAHMTSYRLGCGFRGKRKERIDV